MRARRLEQPEQETSGCEGCKHWKTIRQKARVADLLQKIIDKLKKRIAAEDFKPSISDYLKLIEVEEALEHDSDAVKEIKVTWVEPKESDTAR